MMSSTFYSHLFFFFFVQILDFVHLVTHQAEKASLSHIVDLMSVIVLTAIWAVCPRDSLALLGHWVQEKLSQVRCRMLSLDTDTTVGYIIFELMNTGFVSLLADIQSSL